MLDNKFSNIIGTKIPSWVLKQLETRANKNTQDTRDNDNILYLANKTAWVRLVSSVNILNESDLVYFKRLIGEDTIKDSTSLAKNFVLFGGTSKYLNKNSYGLRSGLGKDKAYGILGDSEIRDFGYRPMPGITSVNIETQGRLGSVRAATIEFKCWDKDQLDIMDSLYFKLGFTMFLEWGHTYFYPSPDNKKGRDPNKIISTELYSIDPFEQGLTKEEINIQIAQNSRDSEGNYEAMLGIVTNFNFTYNQEGGYDCTLRLMALGILGDSIKINNVGVLPNLLKEEILQLNNTLIQISNQSKPITITDPQNKLAYPECVRSGRLVNFAKGEIPDTSNRRLADNAIIFKVGNSEYYFYQDGRYQTTGFSRTGTYSCDGENVNLNEQISILAKLNELINKKDTLPTTSELRSIISQAGYTRANATINQNQPLNISAQQTLPGTTIPSATGAINAGIVPIDTNLSNYDFLYNIGGDRGDSLLFPRFGIFLPEKNINQLIGSITIDNTYLFDRINQFLDLKLNPNQQTVVVGQPAIISNLQQSIGLQSQQPVSVKKNLETLIFENRIITANDSKGFGPIRFDFNYTGTNKKIYYNSIRVSFPEKNPNNRDEDLNREDVYKSAIAFLRSTNEFEFTQVGFEVRLVGEQFRESVKPFGTVSENTNSANSKYPVIILSGKINVEIDGTTVKQVNRFERVENVKQIGKIKIPVDISIFTTDTDIIKSIKKSTNAPNFASIQNEIKKQDQQETTTEEQTKEQLKAVATQVDQALKYQSIIEIMLRTIQVHALNKAINKTTKPDLEIGRTTYILDITNLKDRPGGTPFLNQVFSNGVFSKYINDLIAKNKISISEYTDPNGRVTKLSPETRFKIQAKYGFASSLMANKEDISLLYPVDFESLLRAYVIPYQINQEIIKGTYTNHPVYIPLGLLLMILNHSCTIYDSKENSSFQTPLVYIDFNPEMNFFLSNTKHLSTDPWTCLIPFEGSNEDYKSLFSKDLLQGDSIKPVSGSTEVVPLFKPENQDFLSGTLPKLKADPRNENIYRAKVMNILLNVDYLVDVVQKYSYKDGTNSVYLKTFLEQVLSDINKSLGNFNSFRLSYNDAANTFQIVDDQFIPALPQEEQITPKPKDAKRENTTELPLLGKFSIAKNLEIRSEISSRLSNMLAISANSNYTNKATLSVNGDAFGFVNTSYADRYITNRQEIIETGSRINNDALKSSAAQFNSAISDFYSKINPSQTTVAHATNYYMDKMAIIKNDEYPTRAAAMIPVSVNFTTDGISGLSMGQAFTIPEKLLPYTYTTRRIPGAPVDHTRNVGFVLVGLTHTIESNQWNTQVKANMIYLKDSTEFSGSVVKVEGRVGEFGVNESNEVDTVLGNIPVSDLNLNQTWERIAFDFISKKEGFLDRPKPDEGNLRAGYGTDTIVLSDGTIKKVSATTVFTKEDADRTLTYQIGQFSKTVIRQIGQSVWDNLSNSQKASLVSYAYNVGSLRPELASLIKSNASSQIVANQIILGPTTGKQSGKVYPALVQRRKEEASLYLS